MSVFKTEDGKELIITCTCGCGSGIEIRTSDKDWKDFGIYSEILPLKKSAEYDTTGMCIGNSFADIRNIVKGETVCRHGVCIGQDDMDILAQEKS